jgi:hypothetical protein
MRPQRARDTEAVLDEMTTAISAEVLGETVEDMRVDLGVRAGATLRRGEEEKQPPADNEDRPSP